jgi:FAD/FMN-containing dehydrogenase
MRENVLSMKVVLPDGRMIQTSRRAKKSAAGYDLTRLFIGSEGTLGIITEVTVKLYPVQEAMSAAVCAFPTIDGATNPTAAVRGGTRDRRPRRAVRRRTRAGVRLAGHGGRPGGELPGAEAAHARRPRGVGRQRRQVGAHGRAGRAGGVGERHPRGRR